MCVCVNGERLNFSQQREKERERKKKKKRKQKDNEKRGRKERGDTEISCEREVNIDTNREIGKAQERGERKKGR